METSPDQYNVVDYHEGPRINDTKYVLETQCTINYVCHVTIIQKLCIQINS